MNKEQTYLRTLVVLTVCISVYVFYVYFIKGSITTKDKSKHLSHAIISSISPKRGALGTVHTPKMTNQEIRERLGRSTWTLLHTMAAVYPAFPTVQHKKDTLEFIYLLSRLYPCGDCCEHFQRLLTQYPPQISSHDDFVGWLCKAHNVVNKRLGKPEVDCTKIEGMWPCGCSAD